LIAVWSHHREFLTGIFLGLSIGVCIGTLHNLRARRDWQWRLGRKLQFIAQRNEMNGGRHKRQRPMISSWQKCLPGWLQNCTRNFFRFTIFRPKTLVGWHR
jgi:hypothetical protein